MQLSRQSSRVGRAPAGRRALRVHAGKNNASLAPPAKKGAQQKVAAVEAQTGLIPQSFVDAPMHVKAGAGVAVAGVAAGLAKAIFAQNAKNDVYAAQQLSRSSRKAKPIVDKTAKKEFTGRKRTVIITGASSGVGKNTASCLLESGHHHVVMAVRDVEKAQAVADELEWNKDDYTILQVELGSLKSVSNFVKEFRQTGLTLDCLCCNAALYLPNQPGPTWTEDGYETSFGVNQMSHYLMCRMMIKDLQKGDDPRCVIVGSITGNTNTVGGGAIRPLADLGMLDGLRDGSVKNPVGMVDGGKWDGSKAYKDSKLSNMTTILELHRRYNDSTGICFTSLYPGCIADSPLFRQKRGWFRALFPVFMKYVTGGYVPARAAGVRVAQVCSADECQGSSGVYWSWNGRAPIDGITSPVGLGRGGEGGELFENLPSREVRDVEQGNTLWELCEREVMSYLEEDQQEESKATVEEEERDAMVNKMAAEALQLEGAEEPAATV